MRYYKFKIAVSFAIITVFISAIWYAPKYLAYADKPSKSDVVVLFVGSKLTTPLRLREALNLINEGFAQHLLIPANGTFFEAPVNNVTITNRPIINYPSYFDDTHREMLEVKKVVDKKGFRSAIFVSSPFHMRRIKIMADNIFDSRFLQMKFVPARYEPGLDSVWLSSMCDLKMAATEYIKVIWFMAYRHFVAQERLI